VTAMQHAHEWSKDALLNKAQRYAEIMLQQDRDIRLFGFWSALTLEMLARAALAAVSPTLLADKTDWRHIYFALGHGPTGSKFIPKSATTSDVFERLESILEGFTREMHGFSITHINRRNNELHSGNLAFDSLRTSQWLGTYYKACKVLLESVDSSFELLFGDDEAETAETLIGALEDEAAKAVQRTINAHRTIWEEKLEAEREELRDQAKTVSLRRFGHRAVCPSCGSIGLLHGTPVGVPSKSLEGELVVERQTMLPANFECVACGLKVSGYSMLNACGLGDVFTQTSRYDAVEYFGPSEEEVWEDDFNEY
jgi:hypothetical protein